MWYCPVKLNEYDNDNKWCVQNLGHSEQTLNDLWSAVVSKFTPNTNQPLELQLAICYHAVWVPRSKSFPQVNLYPVITISGQKQYWPAKQTDANAGTWPVLSDRLVKNDTTGDPNPLHLNGGNGGHPFNGQMKNLNILYGDAHVERHKLAVVQMQYDGNYYNFY
jgi:hypothetical protein